MKQAFIIMQIGNPDLDTIFQEAILPALKSCGFDPKRVDKHNEGRLLKSEIVEFIESSDIIVADLTNERPNCYLEVGYAMGLDKFRNLILTAREDHYQDSPNYSSEGPKIHFDLSGYDILFWESDKLVQFKDELETRVRRRMATLTPKIPSLVSPWDKEWISKHKEAAFSGLKQFGKSEFMEIRMTLLEDFNLNVAQGDLLTAANNAQIHTFGWPLGVISNDKEYHPKPTVDGIVAKISLEDEGRDEGSYDYWTIRKDGSFYLLKSLFEDRKPGYIFYDTRIIRITEALLYAVRLYSGLKVKPESLIRIGIRHGGLKDHILSSAVGREIFTRKSDEDKVYTEIDTTLEKIESDLVDLVEEFTQPLFIIFNFFKIEKESLKKIVDDFVAGRI